MTKSPREERHPETDSPLAPTSTRGRPKSETLHGSDGETCNDALFAIFSHGAKTLVARPGDAALCGSTEFERARSAAFGEAWMFQSHYGLGLIRHCRAGEVVGVVGCFEVSP